MSLYAELGEELIRTAIERFYAAAFADVMIGFLFADVDRAHLIAQQQDFAITMLGGPKLYKGRPLVAVHSRLPLRRAHFQRRQVLMQETLADLQIPDAQAQRWLAAEAALRPLILSNAQSCQK